MVASTCPVRESAGITARFSLVWLINNIFLILSAESATYWYISRSLFLYFSISTAFTLLVAILVCVNSAVVDWNFVKVLKTFSVMIQFEVREAPGPRQRKYQFSCFPRFSLDHSAWKLFINIHNYLKVYSLSSYSYQAIQGFLL